MLKKLGILLTLTITLPYSLHAYETEFEAVQEYPDISGRVQKALAEAKKALNTYVVTSQPESRKDIIAYLPYFRSWGGYQAVTPAPSSLAQKINNSQAASTYIAELKRIAQQFKQEPTPGMAGASSLSADGVTFYEYVINMAQKRLVDYQNAKSATLASQTMSIPDPLETRLM